MAGASKYQSPISDQALRLWLATLGTPASQQRAQLEDLLSHAIDDQMSGEDRASCLRAYELLVEDTPFDLTSERTAS